MSAAAPANQRATRRNLSAGVSTLKRALLIPASKAQADVAPPPQAPTTKLATVNAPNLKGSLATTAGTYLGSAIGGEIGAQVGGGADLSSAASSTLSNLGTTLKEPLTSTAGGLDFSAGVRDLFTSGPGGTAPVASASLGDLPVDAFGSVASASDAAAASTGTTVASDALSSTIGGAAGAGLLTAGITAGIGAIEGEQIKTYAPQAIGAGAGCSLAFSSAARSARSSAA